ncbi:hypothetical protein CWI38_0355p0020 [Hamiltosporidium tvaerminnensis]|uniref:Uncharacterized protein n=1 Tax=Hamiltosporidium tvaerminnensis TaxID=1176355 RepID=A0A4V2JXZ6_9MICR|nr:hypothetical protein CWI38_0355p0020 [Hamiltosporidium tvaerminnensis]
MILYIQLFFVSFGFSYDAILVDPFAVEEDFVSIPYNAENNESIRNILKKFDVKDSPNYFDKLIPIIEIYTKNIYLYFNKDMYEFIMHYVCIICYIKYYYESKRSEQKTKKIELNIELLFNLISTFKLYWLCKTEKKFNEGLVYVEGGLIDKVINMRIYPGYEDLMSIDKMKQDYPLVFNRTTKLENFEFILQESNLEHCSFKFSSSELKDKNLQYYISKSSFERLFTFIFAIKYFYIFYKNLDTIDIPDYTILLNKKFSGFVNDISLWFPQLLMSYLELDDYKHLYRSIFEETLKSVSRESNSIDKIFELEKSRNQYMNYTKDYSFPKYLFDLFMSENDLQSIISIYNFLKEILKKEYYSFISTVLLLKSSCLIEKNMIQERFLRVIFEIIFFVDIIEKNYSENDFERKITSEILEINARIENLLKKNKKEFILDDRGNFFVQNEVLKVSLSLKIMLQSIFYLSNSKKKLLYSKVEEKLKNRKISYNTSEIFRTYFLFLVAQELNLKIPDDENRSASKKEKSNIKKILTFGVVVTLLVIIVISVHFLLKK